MRAEARDLDSCRSTRLQRGRAGRHVHGFVIHKHFHQLVLRRGRRRRIGFYNRNFTTLIRFLFIFSFVTNVLLIRQKLKRGLSRGDLEVVFDCWIAPFSKDSFFIDAIFLSGELCAKNKARINYQKLRKFFITLYF